MALRGFDAPSFLTGLLVGAFVGALVINALHARPARGDEAAEAALFRACAVQERRAGNQDAERLFRDAARAIGGQALQALDAEPSRSTCIGLRAVAEVYVPMLAPQ